MENEDLIKKLENIELPEIELKSHKMKLKMALLESDYFQKRPGFFGIFKKSLAFVVPTLVLLIVFGVTIIQPKLSEGKALKIAQQNPEIKKLMEERNLILSEVKVKDGKAFILLNPPEETEPIVRETFPIKLQKTKEDEKEDIEGAVVEVSLKEKEVAKINPIKWDDILPLVNNEKESAQEIVEAEEIVEKIIPKEAKIEKIQSSLPPKIHLIEKDDEVKVVPHPETEKKAQVYYTFDGKKWVIKINLTEKRIEEIRYSLENQNLKGRE